MKQYNVLKESWIPIRTLKGEYKKASPMDIINNGHTYAAIVDSNFQYVYGILNFLRVIIMSAYKLKSLKDKENLLGVGRFDTDIVQSYIDKCEKNRPNCFDLLDEKNPFYQNPYAKLKLPKYSSETKNINLETVFDGTYAFETETMVGKVAVTRPAGNNTIHFHPDSYTFDGFNCEEATKALLSVGFFQSNFDSSTNSASGPNGLEYPIYFVLKGKNLFDTIVLNLITEDTWNSCKAGLEYAENAAWEIDPEPFPKTPTSKVSLTEGLTFLNRSILLGPTNENGEIEYINFHAGRLCDKSVDWRQLDGLYKYKYKGKKKEFLKVNPNTDMHSYTLLNSLVDKKAKDISVLTLKEAEKLFSSEILKRKGYSLNKIYYELYYIALSRSTTGGYPQENMGVIENYIPNILLDNEECSDIFEGLIFSLTSLEDRIVKKLAEFLARGRYADLGNSEKAKLKESVKDKIYNYYQTLDNILFSDFLMSISNIEDSINISDEFEVITNKFKVRLKDCLVNAASDLMNSNTSGMWIKIKGNKTYKYRFYPIYDEYIRIINGICNEELKLSTIN